MNEQLEQAWLAKQPAIVRMLVNDATIFYPDNMNAIIGIARVPIHNTDAMVTVLVYDMDKVVANLVAAGMTEDEAIEFVEFNIVGGWLGPFTPIHLWPCSEERWAEEHEQGDIMPPGFMGIGHRCGQQDMSLFRSDHPASVINVDGESLTPCHVTLTV